MLMTIDPGIAGTGIAIFKESGELLLWQIITPKGKDAFEKMCDVVNHIEVLVQTYEVKRVYVEEPAYFQSAKGLVSARSGALMKLGLLVGQILGKFNAKTLKVITWKGQLSKTLVEKRMNRILPTCKAKSHAIDAVCMGLYLQGRF